MDVKSMVSCSSHDDDSSSKDAIVDVVDDHEGPLPGFRFHPTDEELVSFYLKRKVQKRPLSIEIIKQIDIYKHDPWDLAKANNSVGDKEWYFYCKRGRKYRNSIRPNRVTGSGFWKATGIDRPIYSNGGEGHHCIGLKKSLVYYRGSAGKGTKTDWMMHEFRLPSDLQRHEANSSPPKDTALEAEIWTLCRIFKRNKRQTPDWRELSARRNTMNSSSKTNGIDSNTNQECYISFATRPGAANYGYSDVNNTIVHDERNINTRSQYNIITDDQKGVYFPVNHQQEQLLQQEQWNSTLAHTPTASYSSTMNVVTDDENDLQSFAFYGHNWDDLNSVVEFTVRTPPL